MWYNSLIIYNITSNLSREYWWSIKVSVSSQTQHQTRLSCGRLINNFTDTWLIKIFSSDFIRVKLCIDRSYISFGVWIVACGSFFSNAAWIEVWKLCFWLIQDNPKVNKLQFTERFIWLFDVEHMYAMLLSHKAQCPEIMWFRFGGAWRIEKKIK